LIICLGINNLESLGDVYDKNIEFFYKTPIINISCNPANEDFGQINLVDINLSTVSEIIYKIIKEEVDVVINENIATNLLTGIIIKTKNFKNPDLTPETLAAASSLISLGARREEIINQLYRFKKVPDLKLWGRVLNNLKISEDKKIVWSTLNEDKVVNNYYENLRDLNEELIINLPEAKLFLAFTLKQNSISFFIFPLNNININRLVNNLTSGNNPNLLVTQKNNEWQINNSNEESINSVIHILKTNLDKIGV
jgi:bifunctional oligoribonuclease and PAP phosphatase NrnA